jgi:hypothetical protein
VSVGLVTPVNTVTYIYVSAAAFSLKRSSELNEGKELMIAFGEYVELDRIPLSEISRLR